MPAVLNTAGCLFLDQVKVLPCHLFDCTAVWQRLDLSIDSFCLEVRTAGIIPDSIITWASEAAVAATGGYIFHQTDQILKSERGQIKPQSIRPQTSHWRPPTVWGVDILHWSIAILGYFTSHSTAWSSAWMQIDWHHIGNLGFLNHHKYKIVILKGFDSISGGFIFELHLNDNTFPVGESSWGFFRPLSFQMTRKSPNSSL